MTNKEKYADKITDIAVSSKLAILGKPRLQLKCL